MFSLSCLVGLLRVRGLEERSGIGENNELRDVIESLWVVAAVQLEARLVRLVRL